MAGATMVLPAIGPLVWSQAWALQNDPIIKQIMASFVEANDLAADLPIVTCNQMVYAGSRVMGGQSMGVFREIDGSNLTNYIAPTPFQETLYLIQKPVTVDIAYEDLDTEITDIWEFQIDQVVDGISYARTNVAINNSHVAGQTTWNDINAPIGLLGRMLSTTDQLTLGIQQALLYNAGVDWSYSEWSSGNDTQFFANLDAAAKRMGLKDTFKGMIIACNDPFTTAMDAVVKNDSGKGGFSITEDQYDRMVRTYKGAPFRNFGRLPADIANNQSEFVISNAESSAGAQNAGTPSGSNTYTSVYPIRTGVKHCHLLQQAAMMRTPKIWMPDLVHRSIGINWSMGMALETTLDVARISGINVAGVPT